MTVSKYNKDQLTFLANAVELNALSVESIVEWCDIQILNQDNPDEWLIELSMTKKNPISIVKQLVTAGASLDIDDGLFMVLLSGAYFQKRINANRAVQLLMERFCFIDWEEMTELRQEIYVIDDELDWNKSKALKRLDALLREYKANYVGIISEIGIKT